MAKAIYALKLYLSQDQFKMTGQELKGVTEICFFIALACTKAWCRVPRPEQAPSVDLEFLQDINTLQEGVIISVAKEAQTAMKRHLWYLFETLVGLAFFDKELDEEEKGRMQDNLSKPALKKVSKCLECKTSFTHSKEKSYWIMYLW